MHRTAWIIAAALALGPAQAQEPPHSPMMPSMPLVVAPCIRLQPSARSMVVDWPLAST